MSDLRLRLPASLHEAARQAAAKEQISLNQLNTLALAEKLSALMTEDYLGPRADRGNREKFETALSKVSQGKPLKGDEI